MLEELVVNARSLSGSGPLWMLYETALRSPAERVRLIVSDEATAGQAIGALRAIGLGALLDPIGDEFHIICPAGREAAPLLLEWLQGRAL
jgi:hypothetical protein